MNSDLMSNLDRIHTTAMGLERIKKNLGLHDVEDLVGWCKDNIENADDITKRGKNWYVSAGNAVITVNASAFTIITAHKLKRRS